MTTRLIAPSMCFSTAYKGRMSPKVGGDAAYAAYMSAGPNTTKSDLPAATNAMFFLVAP